MVITNVGSYTRLAFGSVSTFLLDNLVTLLSTAGYTSFSDPPNDAIVHHVKRTTHLPHQEAVAFAVLIPILVILSGLFAGLTLGYMSLDETQLNVLSISGTPYFSNFLHFFVSHPDFLFDSQQREYAEKIKPIRKDGHLLLVTLLLSNMIVNETLPVIADSVLGGGIQSVVLSTALIVM
jgi:metal transporter CNNM